MSACDDLKTGEENKDVVANGTNDLICAFCHKDKNTRNVAIGICKDCKSYLCNECLTSHLTDDDVRRHRVAYFYCAHKMRVNKKVRATSFCLDCGQFLCHKCVLDHPGFRVYRHHTFIGDSTIDVNNLSREKSTSRGYTAGYNGRSIQSKIVKRPESDGKVVRKTERDSKHVTNRLPKPLSSISSRKESEANRQQASTDSVFVTQRTLIHTTGGDKSRLASRDHSRQRLTLNKKSPKSTTIKEVAKPAYCLGNYTCRLPDDDHPCRVIFATILANNSVVFADEANLKIKLADIEFNVKTGRHMEPFPVALCPSTSIDSGFYASSGSKVYRMDADQFLNTTKLIETNIPAIEGITNWINGIVVIFRGCKSKFDKKGHWEIHLLNLDGEIEFEISVGSPFAVKLLTPVWYMMTVDDNMKLIVSDTFNNRLICIDLISWQVVYVLKGKESGGAPRCLTVDTDDNLLVTWYGEIHAISQSGTDLGMPVSNISKDSVIAFNTSTNQLLLFNDGHNNRDVLRVYSVQ